LAAAVLTLAACGGGDGDGGSEADARGAVADLLEAAGDGDAAAACGQMTEAAQRQVAAVVGKATGVTGDCAAVTERLLAAPSQQAVEQTLADAADQVRSGDLEGDASVSVAVAEDSGTVTITGDQLVLIPVEEVSGEWLVSDARGLLFGTGGD
jgi:hypothetical protein